MTKHIADVAQLSITGMQQQLDLGAGRKVFKTIPRSLRASSFSFFKLFIANIDHQKILKSTICGVAKISHKLKMLTLNRHNSAINKVYS